MKLLLVEDSASLQRTLGAGLRNSGFTLDQATDGLAAADLIDVGGYDVIVLDLMIPGIDGQTLLKRMRQSGDTTFVLVLSARDTVEDRVRILDIGADDYLTKPCDFDELVSRLHALLRRDRVAATPAGSAMSNGDLELDVRAGIVSWKHKAVSLTRHEIGLLSTLLRWPGQVFSHDQLIERLYPNNRTVSRNALEAHVCTLRRKLKSAGVPPLIRTRRGFGYSALVPKSATTRRDPTDEAA